MRIRIRQQQKTIKMENRKIREIGGQFRDKRINENKDDVYTFVASTAHADRHGTVLNIDNWDIKNFNSNPIIGYQHNVYGGDMCNAPNPDDVIGKGIAYLDGDLMVDVIFDTENELAMKIKSKVDRGFLRTVSVGFLEIGEARMGNRELKEDPSLQYYEGQELLELSIVNIPSNPNAKKKALRSQTYDALRFIYKELGGNKRMSEIEAMTVREVIDLIEGKEEKKRDLGEFNYRISKMKLTALTVGNK